MQDILILKQRMTDLFWKVAKEKEQTILDGTPGFNEKAQFTNGKVIHLAAYVVTSILEHPDQEALEALSEIIAFTARMKMETWGILNALEGLYRLQKADLLSIVDPNTLALLKTTLDWRTFVNEKKDFALIHKPTNYYGVAFGIARYRELLGWEEVKYSAILLDHLLTHIQKYSGHCAFMDETPGQGRFDRYSILVPAEIGTLVLNTDWSMPELILSMLRASSDIALFHADPEGTGFSYGRSIGAYGDTGTLQILSTAARLHVLTEEELPNAFAYCQRLIHTLVHFWYNESMSSINMWEKGRKTDTYRNKNRILGENISLSLQIMEAVEQWEAVGWDLCQDSSPVAEPSDFWKRFSFTDTGLPRELILYRDGDKVWSLPIISGGEDYFDRDPYLPVPRCNHVLEAVPEATHGAWMPCVRMKDGKICMPSARISKVETEVRDHLTLVVYLEQDGFVIAKDRPMHVAEGMKIHTVYTFSPGSIVREDTITLAPDVLPQVDCIQLNLDCMQGEVDTDGFGTGGEWMSYKGAKTIGYCLDTPRGSCSSRTFLELTKLPEDGIVRVSWIFHTSTRASTPSLESILQGLFR